jgi:hypothetical protein
MPASIKAAITAIVNVEVAGNLMRYVAMSPSFSVKANGAKRAQQWLGGTLAGITKVIVLGARRVTHF